ncbi:helix-turn-helix transcriptional regulator [Streptomyces niveiscabiei]|uniref:helix-turn-helix domain-containing protein n=1 Tax=Streptomyces niveiscabiei TaxID=164115 RepID=UPI0029BEB603|nr:helix-turn-helix transcriptional regulator [Streptomyces niveiscabiei]MDX3380351.1 helix-turn-helix transcriptional regulator [Streptomyces niveiscabiei]
MTDGAEILDEDGDGVEAVDDHEREPDPSDSLKTFGAVVQGLREHQGLSREQFGLLVGYSKHTVESVELGRRMPDESFVDKAENALGNTGALRKAARFLTRGEAGLAVWFRKWARLEKKAVRLGTYECRLVPGLLQSEEYLRALFEHRVPLLSDEQIEDQVFARMERQELLRGRPNVEFSFILEEHLFRRRMGGADQMRRLIDHVLDLSQLRNVSIQLVPLEAGLHSCTDGPIRLLETPKQRWLAYSEGQENGRLISDPKAVSVLRQRYERLRSQAPNPHESRGLLEQLRGEL